MSTKRVLIVEDDAHIADLLRMHLGDEGYEVAHAASGDAGLRLLEQDGPWDALVLDVMLPGVDGLQVCQRARAMARYVPIIIISARGSETQRIVGLELGADDYLAKPFSMPELVARVRALLRRAEAMAQSARIDAGAIELGGLQLDPVARTASVDGNSLELTRANSTCCCSSPVTRTRCSRAWSCSTRSGATSTTATSTRSTPISIACAARSSPTRPTRGGC